MDVERAFASMRRTVWNLRFFWLVEREVRQYRKRFAALVILIFLYEELMVVKLDALQDNRFTVASINEGDWKRIS